MELQLTVPEENREVEETAAAMQAVLSILASKYPAVQITPVSDVFANGLIDSQEFLDIILEVEGLTGLVFNPEALDFNGTMTPLTLAQAFKVT